MFFIIAYPNQMIDATASHKEAWESFKDCQQETTMYKQQNSRLIPVAKKSAQPMRINSGESK